MSILKSILKWLGILLAIAAIVIMIGLAWSSYEAFKQSEAARAAAKKLCAELTPGMPIEAVLVRAKELRINVGYELFISPDGTRYEFQFKGWMGGGECRVQTADGKVTTAVIRDLQ